MKHFRHILVFLIILAVGLLASCGQSHDDAEPADGTAISISANSILSCTEDAEIIELADQVARGEYPVEATIQYDSVDGCSRVTTTDAETIKDLCQRLSLVEVVGKCNQSITDNYHCVSFKLSDASCVTFNFEGEHIWSLDSQNFSIENSEELFALMRDLVGESEPMKD